MNLIKNDLTIRNTLPSDAEQLCLWWNDGSIMAHAGFPEGLNTTAEEIRESLSKDSDETRRRHIIEYKGSPIGEMNYRNKGKGIAEIGIKICESGKHDKGLGTTLLSMFIDALFNCPGFIEIILDTNINNKRAQHVYENKLGFKVAGESKWQDRSGKTQYSIHYLLTKENWFARSEKPECSSL